MITDVNPFLEDLLGYSHTELVGKALWEIGPVQDIAATEQMSEGEVRLRLELEKAQKERVNNYASMR